MAMGPMTLDPLTSTEFQVWLDTFGADPERWPDRPRAEALLASSAVARGHWAEARVLDRLLTRTGVEQDRATPRARLIDDIVKAAERTPRLAVVNTTAVEQNVRIASGRHAIAAHTDARSGVNAHVGDGNTGARLGRTGFGTSSRMAAGLMAASLILGVGLGTTPLGKWTAPQLPAIAQQDDGNRVSDLVLAMADADDDQWTLGL